MKISVFLVFSIPFYLLFISESKGKVFEKCELAETLRKEGLEEENIASFVCIAKYESRFNTKALARVVGGVKFYGLFQISGQYWCSPPPLINACNMECEKLRDDELNDDIKCIQHILRKQGFKAWGVWNPHCRQNVSDYVKECEVK